MFFSTIEEAREAAIEEAGYSDTGMGSATANLRNGDHVTVLAHRTSGGNVRCKQTRGAGHLTTEPATGGLADQIRDARRDVYDY